MLYTFYYSFNDNAFKRNIFFTNLKDLFALKILLTQELKQEFPKI